MQLGSPASLAEFLGTNVFTDIAHQWCATSGVTCQAGSTFNQKCPIVIIIITIVGIVIIVIAIK